MSDIEEKKITAEELLKKYKKERAALIDTLKKQDEIIEQLFNANDAQWDMITIQKAAAKSGLSVPTIYRYINERKLKTIQHKGGRIMVSEKELLALDDPYKAVAQ